jgi:glycerol-3-phosphate acyltransferase PlsY
MNKQKVALIFGIFIFPIYASAHGEEVLLPLILQLCSILVFLFWIIVIDFRLSDKAVLTASYFLTLGLMAVVTQGLPYRENKTLLDITWITTPAVICLVTLIIMKRRKKRRSKMQTDKTDYG